VQLADLMRICFKEELEEGGIPDTAESLAAKHSDGRWSRVMVMGTRVIGFVCLDEDSSTDPRRSWKFILNCGIALMPNS
jgi:hypothetical protein